MEIQKQGTYENSETGEHMNIQKHGIYGIAETGVECMGGKRV
jgi:hypothetical protein